MLRWTIIPVLTLLSVAPMVGCNRDNKPPEAREMAEYVDLPAVRQTGYQPLRDELDRLTSEKATPAQLEEARAKLRRGDVTAERLEKVYPPARRHLLQQARRLMPAERFEFDPTALIKIGDVAKTNERSSNAFRKLIRQPSVHLELDFKQGVLANYAVLDSLELAGHVEALRAATAMDKEDVPAAITALRSLIRISELQADEAHLVPRLAGAQRRIQAAKVAEYIARHRFADRETLRTLFKLFDSQLARWPAERAVWIAERAHGLHLFEMVRDGHILSLLSEEDVELLTKKRSLDAMLRALDKTVDQDQLYYLSVMRDLVNSCKLPLHTRQEVFDGIMQDLAGTRGTADYPLVADKLLIVDFDRAHRWLAEERAFAESLSLCLAEAAGDVPPSYKLNPLSGKAYEIERTATHVRVQGLTVANKPYTIEIPTQQQ